MMTHCLFDDRPQEHMLDEMRKMHLEMVAMRKEMNEILRILANRPPVQPKPKKIPRRKVYDPEFEVLWKQYPKRNGANDKYKAEQAWKARIREADDAAAEKASMAAGAERYGKWCDATENTGTGYVMQAARFFGRSQHYLEAWDLPKPEAKRMTDDEFVAHHTQQGNPPKPGESIWQYRDRIGTR